MAVKVKSLIDLASDASHISRLLLESKGELTPEIEALLDVNEQGLTLKADNYRLIIEDFESQAALWKRRKDVCAAQQKKFEAQVARMNDRIKVAMRVMGRTEVAGAFYKFQLRRSRASLVIDDESAIPGEFKIVVQTTAVDKERVRAAIEAGKIVSGAHLEEGGALHVVETGGKEK